MRPSSSLLGLPASLLLLVAVQVGRAQANARGLPTAIRKMSPDAGEKLLQEYFAFEVEDQVAGVATQGQAATQAHEVLDPEAEELVAVNSSASIPYYAPFAPHFFTPGLDARDDTGGASGWDLSWRARDAVARLQKRDYACPTGTSNCSSIGYPNSCCQTGTECVEITDTGLGPVGCCPDGISCSGSIACSGSQEGCPSDTGGGCCIEGYVCASIGCVQSSTVTATVVIQTSTLTSTADGSPTTIVVTVVVTPSSSTSISSTRTSTSKTTSKTTSTSSSTHTSTTTTQISTSSISTDASTSPGAPVRPTSISTTTTPAGYCPTGFYACSAVYGGGCCQTGRDCQTTSCPATVSTTIISSGETVVVPLTAVPSTTTASTDTCAGGWSLCPSGAGPTAGCCPTGYSCGTASCFLATGSATASVAKELPDSGSIKGGVRTTGLMMIPAILGLAFGMDLI